MKINCEKLTPEERKDFVAKLKWHLKKGAVKMDGAIVCIRDKAEISTADYFRVCALLNNYGVKLEIEVDDDEEN